MGKTRSFKFKEELVLDRAAVDRLSDVLDKWMEQAGIKNGDRLRRRLAMETVLLNLCEHFDEKLVVSVSAGKRFFQPFFSVRYEGISYNPTQDVSDGWSKHLLSDIGYGPSWSFRSGVNELSLKLPHSQVKPELLMLIAFVVAVILGFLLPVIPEGIKTFLNDVVFTTISDVFLKLMGTFAGIMVFTSVISGICGIGNISDFSKMGKYMVTRYIAFSFLGAAVCGAAFIPFFSFSFGEAAGGSEGSSILKLIKDIVPSDPITPFQTGNMLQIVFIAVFAGLIIVLLGRRTEGVRNFTFQLNTIMTRLVDVVCYLLPLYILASLVLLFWEHGMGIFAMAWKPLVLCVLCCFGLMIIKLLIVSVRCKVSIGLLMKKTSPAFLIGLATASSTAAFGTVMDINVKKLGIPEDLNNFGVPIGNILCCSTSAAGFITIIYSLVEYNGIKVDIAWFITAWIVITLISFATPPVSGGTLVVLTVMFAHFGLPNSLLGIAGTLSLIADFFMTSSKVNIIQMELILEAAHWKTLDLEMLKDKSI